MEKDIYRRRRQRHPSRRCQRLCYDQEREERVLRHGRLPCRDDHAADTGSMILRYTLYLHPLRQRLYCLPLPVVGGAERFAVQHLCLSDEHGKYMFNQQINQTTAPSYNVVTKNITIANAVSWISLRPRRRSSPVLPVQQLQRQSGRAVQDCEGRRIQHDHLFLPRFWLQQQLHMASGRWDRYLCDQEAKLAVPASAKRRKKTITDSGAPTDREVSQLPRTSARRYPPRQADLPRSS